MSHADGQTLIVRGSRVADQGPSRTAHGPQHISKIGSAEQWFRPQAFWPDQVRHGRRTVLDRSQEIPFHVGAKRVEPCEGSPNADAKVPVVGWNGCGTQATSLHDLRSANGGEIQIGEVSPITEAP